MKMTWRFRVEAPVEAIYSEAFAPDKWFRFFTAYRGLESVDPNWPEQGSLSDMLWSAHGWLK